MTTEERLDHLFEGHYCSNCGRTTCGNMGEVCNNWQSPNVYIEVMKQLNDIVRNNITKIPIQITVVDPCTVIAKEL